MINRNPQALSLPAKRMHSPAVGMVFIGWALGSLVLQITGCQWFTPGSANHRAVAASFPGGIIPNPAVIPDMEANFLWNQVVDAVDDYFAIQSERPVIKDSQQWLEGSLQTLPQIGGTYLEPWQLDATPGFERLQSSLQTIRRELQLTVVPVTEGYQISVQVQKWLEDVDRSLAAVDGATATRHDGGLVRTDPSVRGSPQTLGWIEMERDFELEQRILSGILGRTRNVEPPHRKLLHHR